MAADKTKEKEIWLGLAHDAISRYQIPDDVKDVDDLVDDMIDVATKYADGMLDELDKRYAGRGGGSSRRRRGEDEPEDPEPEE